MRARVLIVEDEPVVRESLVELCEGAGYGARWAADLAGTRRLLAREGFDLILLDIKLPDGSGLDLLPDLRSPDAPLVIVVTAFPEVETAVRALKEGAYDYVNKPFDLDELEHVIAKAIETRTLRNEVSSFRQSQEQRLGDPLGRMVGTSPAIEQVREMVRVVAASSETTVLILGESGVGKELVAEAIHHQSDRRDGPLLKVNCAAIPSNLLESELFGHEKGAFTDAKGTRKGLFELAHRGTLFLDEIGEMEPSLQVKLLRVLEERTVRRVGGGRKIFVDVRVVAATNRSPQSLVAEGRLRQDLFYRLHVFPIAVPPLRDRGGDIPEIAGYFLAALERRLAGKRCWLSREAADKLLAYDWPGNVRELRNVLERTVLLHPGGEIHPSDILLAHGPCTSATPSAVPTLAELEREHVLRTYRCTGRNKTRTAEALGINRLTLRRKLREYGEE